MTPFAVLRVCESLLWHLSLYYVYASLFDDTFRCITYMRVSLMIPYAVLRICESLL